MSSVNGVADGLPMVDLSLDYPRILVFITDRQGNEQPRSRNWFSSMEDAISWIQFQRRACKVLGTPATDWYGNALPDSHFYVMRVICRG